METVDTKKVAEYSALIDWCIAQHDSTNHLYGDYLPYRFHLELVAKNARKFVHLLTDKEIAHTVGHPTTLKEAIIVAAYGHDLIEDTRVTYNDVKNMLGETVAEIIFALTNEKGRNRSERANEKYYAGILSTPGARFVKLCDRIANVEFGKLMGSRMVNMYRKENFNFEYHLKRSNNKDLEEMFVYLNNLLQEQN